MKKKSISLSVGRGEKRRVRDGNANNYKSLTIKKMATKKMYPMGKSGMTKKSKPVGKMGTATRKLAVNPFAISSGAALAAYPDKKAEMSNMMRKRAKAVALRRGRGKKMLA